jgi:hypothetical protein
MIDIVSLYIELMLRSHFSYRCTPSALVAIGVPAVVSALLLFGHGSVRGTSDAQDDPRALGVAIGTDDSLVEPDIITTAQVPLGPAGLLDPDVTGLLQGSLDPGFDVDHSVHTFLPIQLKRFITTPATGIYSLSMLNRIQK